MYFFNIPAKEAFHLMLSWRSAMLQYYIFTKLILLLKAQEEALMRTTFFHSCFLRGEV